jgi:hypothetical protein
MKVQIKCQKCDSDKVHIDACMVDSAPRQRTYLFAEHLMVYEDKTVERSSLKVRCRCEQCNYIGDLLSIDDNQGLWVMVD